MAEDLFEYVAEDPKTTVDAVQAAFCYGLGVPMGYMESGEEYGEGREKTEKIFDVLGASNAVLQETAEKSVWNNGEDLSSFLGESAINYGAFKAGKLTGRGLRD